MAQRGSSQFVFFGCLPLELRPERAISRVFQSWWNGHCHQAPAAGRRRALFSRGGDWSGRCAVILPNPLKCSSMFSDDVLNVMDELVQRAAEALHIDGPAERNA